jgi:hypothetical protein
MSNAAATPIVPEAQRIFDSLKDAQGIVTLENFSTWFEDFVKENKKRKASASEEEGTVGTAGTAGGQAKKASPSGPSSSSSAGASAIVSGKKSKKSASPLSSLLSSFVIGLKKEIKTKKFYTYSTTQECTVDAIMTPQDFFELFGGEKKAKSVISERTLNDTQIGTTFGSQLTGLSGPQFNTPRYHILSAPLLNLLLSSSAPLPPLCN